MAIYEALKTDLIKDKVICRVLGVLIFVCFTGLGAFVRIPIPFSPVPITLQTFFVLLAGLVLGGRLGAASQILYVALGASGLPIFTNAGFGLTYLLGPTGGYLVGFIVVSFLLGNFSYRIRDNNIGLFSIIMLSSMLILFCGSVWLMFVLKINFHNALFLGMIPFIPGDIIKSIIVYSVYRKIRVRSREVF